MLDSRKPFLVSRTTNTCVPAKGSREEGLNGTRVACKQHTTSPTTSAAQAKNGAMGSQGVLEREERERAREREREQKRRETGMERMAQWQRERHSGGEGESGTWGRERESGTRAERERVARGHLELSVIFLVQTSEVLQGSGFESAMNIRLCKGDLPRDDEEKVATADPLTEERAKHRRAQ